jgi:NADH:ubiquinone oxidoreductase subunit 5 (subunit L)/multisubunit Na+/H+ antiporter MnhA subunit
MDSLILVVPILIIFSAAALAALFGTPRLNRRLVQGQLTISRLCWLLALAPVASFIILLALTAQVNEGQVIAWSIDWLPAVGLPLTLYLDGLSAFFALLVTFIGALIIIYTGQYFKGDPGAWRFLAYIFLFMGAMLGLVMAGDVITLFIFWEGTSITSFLLVAYKTKDVEARRGAFKALFITGGGGIALLAGLLFVGNVAGGTTYVEILGSGDALRESPYYLVMLGLVAFGAFTKSAQFPAHIWLPGAMSAPTPASAYLHSATMVKAGIYLLARLNPVLGLTEAWFWLLSIVGLTTMLVGAYLGLRQNDLKALLAYSTIAQLGILVVLIAEDISEAYKALVIGILAHALYKSALFLAAGIVDHETGTRDLRRLGGLRKSMPFTFMITAIAALSMAGLPPLFGFLAKETLLATAVYTSLPEAVNWIFPAAAVIAGALVLAQAGMLVWDTFMGRPKDARIKGHDPSWAMLMAPALPALLSLAVGLLPEPRQEAILLAKAASAALGEPVKVSLAPWTGLNAPFVLSLVAISLGIILFIFRGRVRELQAQLDPGLSFNDLYTWVLRAIDTAAGWSTRLQQGKLRTYLVIMITATVVLVIALGNRVLLPDLSTMSAPTMNFRGEILGLRLFALMVVVAAALATVLLRRDFSAILALGAMGLSVALLMVLEPAPDVALVQIVVDILAVVVLVLALSKLPRQQRQKAQFVTDATLRRRSSGLGRDLLIAGAVGLIAASITLTALLSRPRESVLTPYYEASAKPLTGAKDVVGAIVVDFRALDTVIEIAVFTMAGLGVYTLLRYAARKFGDSAGSTDESPESAGSHLSTLGIGGLRTSPFIRVSTYVTLPLSMILAITHIMYGHDQPGDGFTAGVIISLGIGLWYVVFGYDETRRRLPWLKPAVLIGAGILVAITTGTIAALIDGAFLDNIDFGERLGLTLPQGFHLSTSFLLEVAICLTVLGSVAYMLNSLGHPGDRDNESMQRLEKVDEQAR